jgi:hypothetical protein
MMMMSEAVLERGESNAGYGSDGRRQFAKVPTRLLDVCWGAEYCLARHSVYAYCLTPYILYIIPCTRTCVHYVGYVHMSVRNTRWRYFGGLEFRLMSCNKYKRDVGSAPPYLLSHNGLLSRM